MPAKLPWMKFNSGHWMQDPALSMCSPATRGVWIDMIASMHIAGDYKVSGKVRPLSRALRCSSEELISAIEDLAETDTCNVTVTKSNGEKLNGDSNVTVESRRLKRMVSEREKTRKRVQKHRCSAKGNGLVTIEKKEERRKIEKKQSKKKSSDVQHSDIETQIADASSSDSFASNTFPSSLSATLNKAGEASDQGKTTVDMAEASNRPQEQRHGSRTINPYPCPGLSFGYPAVITKKPTRKQRDHSKAVEQMFGAPPTFDIQSGDGWETLPSNHDDDDFRNLLKKFCDMRYRIKPMTQGACDRLMKAIAKLPHEVALDCLDKSIAEEWQDIYPEKSTAWTPRNRVLTSTMPRSGAAHINTHKTEWQAPEL